MDPFSQGITGAVAAQSIGNRSQQVTALLMGAGAGMAADLDVLIRSSTDPLLFLEYHRQFTHSLIFIPLGGLICALVLHQLLGKRQGWKFVTSWLLCSVAYATHGLLDACTTYGTLLFWPFSDTRFAWNNVSIIDPLYTLPLFVLSLLAWKRQRFLFARLAVVWAVAYLSFGVVQRERAEAAGWALAESRGHHPVRLEAKPGFANLVLWKVVYQTDERFYVDAVRVVAKPKVFEGSSLPVLDVQRDFLWLEADSQQRKDIERFRWFSNNYLSPHPDDPMRIVDIRYSMLPNSTQAIWSIGLTKNAAPTQHVDYVINRQRDGSELSQMAKMLFD